MPEQLSNKMRKPMKTLKLRATPIVHLILALNALAYLPSGVNKDHFLAGNILPDFRYMAELGRLDTHEEEGTVCWNDVINEESSFLAGMKFHSLVDLAREDWLVRNSIYDKLEETASAHTAHKFYEDSVVWNELMKKGYIVGSLQNYSNDERNFLIKKRVLFDTAQKWHTAVEEYASKKPDEESIKRFVLDTFGPKTTMRTADAIKKDFQKIKERTDLESSVHHFCDGFMTRIKREPDKKDFLTYSSINSDKAEEFRKGVRV